jgi:hypothetical protein
MNPLHCLVPSFCLSFIVTYLLNVFHHGCSSEFEEEECVSSCNIMSSALLLAQCHFEHLATHTGSNNDHQDTFFHAWSFSFTIHNTPPPTADDDEL